MRKNGWKWSAEAKLNIAGRSNHKGKKHSLETLLKMSKTHKKIGSGKRFLGIKRPDLSALMKNEGNHEWKGEKAGYRAKHRWVEKRLGKPHSCEYCKAGNLSHRSYHWANISKNYERILSDWIRLCAKCHKNYDLNKINLNLCER